MTNELWDQVRQQLKDVVGANNYSTWIEPLEFSELREGVAIFLVPTQFIGNWVRRNFADQIKQLLSSMDTPVSRIEFTLAKRAPVTATTAASRRQSLRLRLKPPPSCLALHLINA